MAPALSEKKYGKFAPIWRSHLPPPAGGAYPPSGYRRAGADVLLVASEVCGPAARSDVQSRTLSLVTALFPSNARATLTMVRTTPRRFLPYIVWMEFVSCRQYPISALRLLLYFRSWLTCGAAAFSFATSSRRSSR